METPRALTWSMTRFNKRHKIIEMNATDRQCAVSRRYPEFAFYIRPSASEIRCIGSFVPQPLDCR
jgi:hypothetical protein